MMDAKTAIGGLLALGLSGLGALPSQAAVLSATYVGPPLVVDFDSALLPSLQLTGTGAGLITDVSVVLEFIKCRNTRDPSGGVPNLGSLEVQASDPKLCVDSGNASPDEIEFLLSSPGGVPIPIIGAGSYLNPPGGSGFVTVHLADIGPSVGHVGDNGYVNELTGVNPTLPFALFMSAGEVASPGDVWELTVTDTAQGDPLGLYRVTLNVTVPDATAVPEPTTLALFGLGMIGLGALKRRR